MESSCSAPGSRFSISNAMYAGASARSSSQWLGTEAFGSPAKVCSPPNCCANMMAPPTSSRWQLASSLLASIEVHSPVDHIGHVATAIKKLHDLLARPCQFCPPRACIGVLLEPPQHLVLKPEIHLTQFGTARASHDVTLAF